MKPLEQPLAALVVLVLLAIACGTSDAPELVADEAQPVATVQATATVEPTTIPTSQPEPTAERTIAPDAPLTLLDQPFLAGVADSVKTRDGAVLLASFDREGVAASASAGTDAEGNSPTASDPFRVGSLTKVFTAAATLTLVEEGLVDLDAPAVEYVSRIAVPDGVTVRHLLRHRTGLFNYTDAPGILAELDNPTRVWSPEDLIQEFVAGESPLFEVDSRFGYSNTNYLILGVLLEEVTGQPYHEVLRQRLLDPLALSASTYVAGFEDGPEPFDPYEHNGQVDYEYTAVATAAWAGGALVSSPADLHVFFSALFDNQIVPGALVEQAIAGNTYGLGLELSDASNGLYGHAGLIPGYSTIVRHSPALGVTAVVMSTDTTVPAMVPLGRMLVGLKDVAVPAG